MKIVLYQTFKIGNKSYVYDTVSNNIFSVSKHIYDYLNNKISINDLTKGEKEMVIAFKESGLLRIDGYKKIKLSFLDNFDDFFDLTKDNIKKLTIVINQICNFRCKYCLYGDSYKARKNLDNSEIKLETAYKGLDFYFKHSSNIQKKNVTFYGGEPLINKTRLFKIIKYARDFYSPENLKINLTTNGLLIDREFIDFFNKNKIYVNISLDGPKQIHDKYRKTITGDNSCDLIINKFKFIKQCNPKYYYKYISISTTITPPYNFNLIEKYFKENKLLSSLKLDLSYVEEKDADWLFCSLSGANLYKQKIKKEVVKIKECVKKHLRGEKISDLYRNIFYTRLKNIIQRDRIQINDNLEVRGSCFPGLNMLLIDTKGNFYICTMLDDSYSIGNIRNGLNKIEIKKALKSIYNFINSNCKNCWLIRICHPCISKFNRKESLPKRPDVCLYRRSVYLELLRAYTKIYLK